MMTQYATLTPEAHVEEAVQTLLRTSQGEFPVIDAEGKPVGLGDPRAQAEQVYKNLRAALDGAGAKPEHIVKWNGYLIGDHDWRTILREARAKLFPNIRPASTHVRVAALIVPDYLFELEAYAIVPE
jgi:enamine deaminase RidA (YjgF/YER057c/UK114 family)